MQEEQTGPEKGALVGKAMLNLSISYELLSQRLEKAMRPLGLNMTQLSLLFHFSWNPEKPQTVSQLVQVMGINQPGLTKATLSMVGKGWMRKESDARDARVKRLYITNQGLDVLAQAKKATLPTLKDGFSCMDARQLENFTTQLQTLKTWLDTTRDL